MHRIEKTALRDLGWRLRHHLAARNFDVDRIAVRVGMSPDDFALALVGEYDLPFSILCAVLDQLDLEWWELYGADVAHSPTTHHLTVPSDTWNAIDGGLQAFDVRRDIDRYRVGDILNLHEALDGKATGRVIVAEVTYILYLASVSLTPGEIVLAIRPSNIAQANDEYPLHPLPQKELQILRDTNKNIRTDDRLWEKIDTYIRANETIVICERFCNNERQYISNRNNVEVYHVNFDTQNLPSEDLQTVHDPVSGSMRPVFIGYFPAQQDEAFTRAIRDLGVPE